MGRWGFWVIIVHTSRASPEDDLYAEDHHEKQNGRASCTSALKYGTNRTEGERRAGSADRGAWSQALWTLCRICM